MMDWGPGAGCSEKATDREISGQERILHPGKRILSRIPTQLSLHTHTLLQFSVSPSLPHIHILSAWQPKRWRVPFGIQRASDGEVLLMEATKYPQRRELRLAGN